MDKRRLQQLESKLKKIKALYTIEDWLSKVCDRLDKGLCVDEDMPLELPELGQDIGRELAAVFRNMLGDVQAKIKAE